MKSACKLVILFLAWVPLLAAQDQSDNTSQHSAAVDKGIDLIFNYLNMAGAKKAADFQPMTQPERNRLYIKTMVNPIGFFKVGFSAGIDQWNDKPEEWGQGASGYGKRFANIEGQYAIQRTVTFGLSSGCTKTTATSIPGNRACGHVPCTRSRAGSSPATTTAAGTFLFPR